MAPSVTIFHNVVWSRHKGAVLSALHSISGSGSIRYSMVQIADTEHDRLGFSEVDYSFHRYPMKKLYDGCYEDVPTWRMAARLTWEVLRTKCDLVVLPGYHRPEYWAMLAACIVTGKRRAVFCDSTARAEHAADCVARLDEAFASQPLSHWREVLDDFAGVWSPYQTLDELYEDVQVTANGYLPTMTAGNGTEVQLVASPAQFDETPIQVERAPEHGEHTETVLLDAGLEWDEIATLKDKGAIL